jgi:outer membrane protein OmpA-like peptidoglycan-associated protein
MLNGKRIPYLENMINSLEQTGPIGKLITVKFLPEDLNLIKSGKLVIDIDDKITGAGDGFAIDFVRLLINPHKMPFTQNIRGKVLDDNTQQGLGGALVSASNIVEILTDANGNFELKNVPAGLALVTASKSGYYSQTIPYDQVSYVSPDPDEPDVLKIYLKNLDESVARMAEDLDKKGTIVLYSIHFETGSAAITQASEEVLQNLAEVIKERPGIKIEVGGHTDSDGADDMNLDLSQRRAQAVVDWLVNKGVNRNNLTAKGYGETNPVASNYTSEGKAANRRVEIKVLHE